ncbi:phage tail protein [Streptomyces sp. NPDC059874]|uniref:phage tail protein n=1 Tax=Streptomyces sp. NPDC059874 TaxID=3346983 RepID=UPI0036582C37
MSGRSCSEPDSEGCGGCGAQVDVASLVVAGGHRREQAGRQERSDDHQQVGWQRLADVTVVRGQDRSQVFTDWVRKTLAEQKPDEEHPDVTVTQYDEQGRSAHRVTLTSARATRWDNPGPGPGLTATEPAVEKVTLVYEGIAVE